MDFCYHLARQVFIFNSSLVEIVVRLAPQWSPFCCTIGGSRGSTLHYDMAFLSTAGLEKECLCISRDPSF